MLSYRHAFHAGHHADVLKHSVLVRVLEHLNQKDKPYWYIETHAGAGCYQLDAGYAAQTAEFRRGIGRLWQRTDLPPGLASYVAQVRALNADGSLRFYPGSPILALERLRADDRLRMFELHSTEFPLLESNLASAGKRAKLVQGDGFAGLKGLLPPASRRALTLIDPSYEEKQDYDRVVACLQDSLRRFATGVYLVWHPLLDRDEARELAARLRQTLAKRWLHATLSVTGGDGPGMTGSGLFVVNPPWTLAEELRTTLAYLRDVLGEDAGARFELASQGD